MFRRNAASVTITSPGVKDDADREMASTEFELNDS
jgi:hypothetical protein